MSSWHTSDIYTLILSSRSDSLSHSCQNHIRKFPNNAEELEGARQNRSDLALQLLNKCTNVDGVCQEKHKTVLFHSEFDSVIQVFSFFTHG